MSSVCQGDTHEPASSAKVGAGAGDTSTCAHANTAGADGPELGDGLDPRLVGLQAAARASPTLSAELRLRAARVALILEACLASPPSLTTFRVWIESLGFSRAEHTKNSVYNFAHERPDIVAARAEYVKDAPLSSHIGPGRVHVLYSHCLTPEQITLLERYVTDGSAGLPRFKCGLPTLPCSALMTSALPETVWPLGFITTRPLFAGPPLCIGLQLAGNL